MKTILRAVSGDCRSFARSRPGHTALIRAAASALFFLFCAHAFCFFNLTYSGDAVILSAAKNSQEQLLSGQFLLPLYFRLRGAVASPMWIGLLSALYLALTACVLLWLLRITQPLLCIALCGLLVVNPAAVSVCAGSLHAADAPFLGLLLASCGALISMRSRLGFIPGACLFAASAAMDSSGISCGAALVAASLLCDLVSEPSDASLLRRAAKGAAAIAAGYAMHAFASLLLPALLGKAPQASLCLPEGGILSAWMAPFRMLFAPLTAYPHVNVALRAVLLSLTLMALALALVRAGQRRALAAAFGALALPLCANLPRFAAGAAGQTSLSFVMLDIAVLAILSAFCSGMGPKYAKRLRRFIACAAGVLILGGVVFSNQVYLKKNLEFHSTLSVMTRVIDRAEQTEGYTPGYTGVAILGNLDDSALSAQRPGFEHLSSLKAAEGNYASGENNLWYVWQILGYPFNFVGEYGKEQIAALPQAGEMPAFPQEGSCRMIGDTLVIKLSDF